MQSGTQAAQLAVPDVPSWRAGYGMSVQWVDQARHMMTKLHEMGEAWFDAETREVAFACLDCKALVRSRATDGTSGHDALAGLRLLHSGLVEQRMRPFTGRIEVKGAS